MSKDEYETEDHPPRHITVFLQLTGDKENERSLIKKIFSTLASFAGGDQFSLHITENGKGHLIDFPNDTTRICPELIEQLKLLINEENWRIDEIMSPEEAGIFEDKLAGDQTTNAPPPDVEKKKSRNK